MDPSFGEAVFLRSAATRIASLGGTVSTQVFGVEIDEKVHATATAALHREFSIVPANLRRSDFFDMGPCELMVDVITGNPPFIRYQRFSGSSRQKARDMAAAQGVNLSALCSSWAPFVIQCVALLNLHGRLGMVVPAEIGHAAYARPVLDYLLRAFRKVALLSFRTRLFSNLSEDTYLLLAEGKGEPPSGQLLWADLESVEVLSSITLDDEFKSLAMKSLNFEHLSDKRFRFVEQCLPDDVQSLYSDLRVSGETTCLGCVADVGIGYVTGANDYFHLSRSEVMEYDVPEQYLMPAVRRGRDLIGVRYAVQDWRERVQLGEKVYLLSIPPKAQIGQGLSRYLREGEDAGTSQTYKCRVRSPWYSVPYVRVPDLFLTYMAGVSHKLVANDASVVAPNTLHSVRLSPGVDIRPQALAVLWRTSLTTLSSEIEGHSLGGGMLKLEPTEAENVLLACGPAGFVVSHSIIEEVDRLYRSGHVDAAVEIVDREFLVRGLGLSAAQVKRLRQAIDALRERRKVRRTIVESSECDRASRN